MKKLSKLALDISSSFQLAKLQKFKIIAVIRIYTLLIQFFFVVLNVTIFFFFHSQSVCHEILT